MRRGEFQNRDRDAGLGDLPEELLRVSGEFGDTPSAGDASDQVYGARAASGVAGVPSELPDASVSVMSVYDSRPINAHDFHFSGSATILTSGG